MLTARHPKAMALFFDLCCGLGRISDIYNRTVDEATANGWLPVPCEPTMRRITKRLLPQIPRPRKSKTEAA